MKPSVTCAISTSITFVRMFANIPAGKILVMKTVITWTTWNSIFMKWYLRLLRRVITKRMSEATDTLQQKKNLPSLHKVARGWVAAELVGT